jgi:hypothetical protein
MFFVRTALLKAFCFQLIAAFIKGNYVANALKEALKMIQDCIIMAVSDLRWYQHCHLKSQMASALPSQISDGISIAISDLRWHQHCHLRSQMASALPSQISDGISIAISDLRWHQHCHLRFFLAVRSLN